MSVGVVSRDSFWGWPDEPVQETPLQKLRSQKDFSTLVIEKDTPEPLVRATLNHTRDICSILTLCGSWGDDAFRRFTPFMDSVTSLTLENSTFTDGAFDEAFLSEICHENPFEKTLDSYVEEPNKEASDTEKNEWDQALFFPGLRPSYWIPDCSGEEDQDDFLFDVKDVPCAPLKQKKEMHCPKLTALTIIHPTRLSEEVFSKLQPLKNQLTHLTLIGCNFTLSSKEIHCLFPNLKTLDIQ